MRDSSAYIKSTLGRNRPAKANSISASAPSSSPGHSNATDASSASKGACHAASSEATTVTRAAKSAPKPRSTDATASRSPGSASSTVSFQSLKHCKRRLFSVTDSISASTGPSWRTYRPKRGGMPVPMRSASSASVRSDSTRATRRRTVPKSSTSSAFFTWMVNVCRISLPFFARICSRTSCVPSRKLRGGQWNA